jgi:hypothetical protein
VHNNILLVIIIIIGEHGCGGCGAAAAACMYALIKGVGSMKGYWK